jgi:CubicO group peptidase (beta-lactamase class C family)
MQETQMRLHRIGALAAALVATTCALGEVFVAGSGQEAPAAEAQLILEGVAADFGVPGMTGAVIVGDGLAWSGGVGFADLELQAPVTRDSVFRLASVSKVLTATLAMRLAQEGRFDLDEDVRTYVTNFPEKGEVITSRQLLGHLGGIRHYQGTDFDPSQPGGMIDLRLYPTTDSALALFAEDDLVAPPGTRYSYSTFGFTLLAAAMARATETPFLELMQRELVEPLGLARVHADEMRAIIPGRVALYDTAQTMLRESQGSGPYRAFPANPAYKWAGGGMMSCAEDLARFGSAVFGPGYLSAESLAEMFTPQRTADGEELGVGLGWRVGTDTSGRRIVHHAGNMPGARSVLVVWPQERVAVSLLSNLSGTPQDILSPALAVGEAFLGGGGAD